MCKGWFEMMRLREIDVGKCKYEVVLSVCGIFCLRGFVC